MPRTNVPMTAQMSRSSGGATTFRLRVEDVASDTIVLDLEIDETAFADLMSTREAKVTATMLPSAKSHSRIGMRRVVKVEEVPREAYDHIKTGDMARSGNAREWAFERRRELGADEVEVRERQGARFEAIFSTYVKPEVNA